MSNILSPPVTRESIFLPAKIIYWTSRLYGVYPFTIIGNIQDGRVEIKIIDRFIAVFNIFLLFCVIWINWNYDLQGIVSTSKVIEGANSLSLYAEILSTMFLTVINFYMKDSIWKLFHKMDKFDKQFRQLYLHHYNEKEIRLIGGFVIAFFIFLLTAILTDINIVASQFGWKFAFLKVTYYYAVIGPHWAFVYNYIVILYLLWHRFKQVTNNLKLLDKQKKRQSFAEHKTIQYSALLFNHLIQCIDNLNESLYIQMLLAVCGTYMYNLFTMFGLYRLIMSSTPKLRSTVLSRLLWNSAYLIYLTIISSMGNLIKCEAGALLSTIQKMLQDEKHSWSFVETLQNLAHQIEHKVPAASCKLFDFDLEFLAIFFGSTSIYFVIMMQFDSDVDDQATPVCPLDSIKAIHANLTKGQ